MSFNPLISIIIPHFNRVELLQETLNSVRSQEYTNWEVLVVDDGSTDEQWVDLQKHASEQVRILKRTDGLKGPSRCRNLGVAEAKGSYLIFVDSDDIVAPWCLSQRVRSIADSPGNDLWVFPVMLFNEYPGDLSVCWNQLDGDDDLERFLRSDPPWHTSSSIWTKETHLAIGGFNEKVLYGDDAELHTKVLLHSVAYRKFPESLPDMFIRRGDEQRITNQWSDSLIESRKTRLLEGTKLLRQLNASKEHIDIWEGQYFVEGEELLFNVDSSKKAILDVITAWMNTYRPAIFRRQVVRTYFKLGSRCRKHAYFLLRVARRIAMVSLPKQFFPTGGEFQHWEVTDEVLQEIHDRI